MKMEDVAGDGDVEMPDFTAVVSEEFGFRKRNRDKNVTSGLNGSATVPSELIDRADVDYVPKGRSTTRRKRVYKPRKRKAEMADSASDEESAPDADMDAYFEGKVARTDEHGDDLFCICRRGDLGKWMIGCDGCDEWYHGDCVQITKLDEDLIDQFFCPRCQKNGNGTTIWKRKCRLQSCRKPAADAPFIEKSLMGMADTTRGPVRSTKGSKYCSRDHGVKYFTEMVAQALLKPGEVKAMSQYAASVDDFKKIGDVAPVVEGIVTDADRKRLEEMEQARLALHESLERTEARLSCLNSMHQRAMRVNTALKARKEKEICGLDERLSIQDTDLDTLITSVGFIDTLLDSATDKLCVVPMKKCGRHAGWYAMKLDSYALEEANIKEDLARLRKEDEQIRLAAQRRVVA